MYNKGGFGLSKHLKVTKVLAILFFRLAFNCTNVKQLPGNFSLHRIAITSQHIESQATILPTDKYIFGNLVCNTFASTPD